MGCCGRNNKKVKNKTEKKKSLINEEKKILANEEINHSIPEKLIDQNQLLKNEPDIQQELIQNTTQITSSSESRKKPSVISSPDEEISSTDNIFAIKSFDDLQTFVEENAKPISILLFYGRYCPYSKRTIPDLRQWARTNKDRIFLYEVDVEQALELAEYYHVRTIPTIMAFEDKNLLAPIWQRTADNVLSSVSIDKKSDNDPNNIYLILDSSHEKSNSMKESDETKQEQDLMTVDQTEDDKQITNTISFSSTIDESNTSLISSKHSSYIWEQSIDDPSEIISSKELIPEYNGRMISQSTISNDDYFKKKRTWSEYFDDKESIDQNQQYIHLPNSNEIFYQKQYDNFDYSLLSDRFSTLTYQHVKDINNREDICILYHGPNRHRGFEDNLPNKRTNSSKLSLLTLKSHPLSE